MAFIKIAIIYCPSCILEAAIGVTHARLRPQCNKKGKAIERGNCGPGTTLSVLFSTISHIGNIK